jgi:hypothetical protein
VTCVEEEDRWMIAHVEEKDKDQWMVTQVDED